MKMTYLHISYYEDGEIHNRYYIGKFSDTLKIVNDFIFFAVEIRPNVEFTLSSRSFDGIQETRYVKLF